MSEPIVCGYGAATAEAFVHGSKAWRHCVRKYKHDGNHVMGLSERQLELMEGTRQSITELEALILKAREELDRMKHQLAELEQKEAAALAAAGT